MPIGFTNESARSYSTMYWSVWVSKPTFGIQLKSLTYNSLTRSYKWFFPYKWAYEHWTRYLKLNVEIFGFVFSPVSPHKTTKASKQVVSIVFLWFSYETTNSISGNSISRSLCVFYSIWFSVFFSARICSGKMCKIIKWLIHWATSFCFVYFFARSFVCCYLTNREFRSSLFATE